MKKQQKPPPEHLGERGGAFWTLVVTEFVIEDHDLPTLQNACEMLDEAEAAREVVVAEGRFAVDRFCQKKEHWACESRRKSMSEYRAQRRELGIDVSVPDSRPPLPKGYR